MVIAETFNGLVGRYTEDTALIEKLWTELAGYYSEKGRHYHNLDHLNALLGQILSQKDRVKDLDAILFALYYHDAVHRVSRKDNEERSALLAHKRLGVLKLQKDRIEVCKKHILATKAHEFSDNADTNLFTDADLSILGQDWDTYRDYAEKIRREYSIYPDLVYNPGRKKVLEHLLQMEKIYKTDPFFAKFEHQARLNLRKELTALI